MTSNTRSGARALIALLFSLFAMQATAGVEVPEAAWLDDLRQGGYVIFFRHGATDWQQNDTDPTNLVNCAAQRNLSGIGRSQAQSIGEGFRALAIPVGKVESSAYCRCLDTAKLAFGKAESAVDLSSYLPESPQEQLRRVHAIRARLATPPVTTTNTVLVSHKIMFTDATGVVLEEGEAAIFKPTGDGDFEYITRVKAAQWSAIAAGQPRGQPSKVAEITVP